MKKITAVLLLMAMMLSSCSDKEANPETQTPEDSGGTESTETKDNTLDDVPEMKFERDVNILMPNISWATNNILSGELNGERLNDAQNAMKLEMEDRFGVSVSEIYTDDFLSTNYVNNLVTSDDDTFDVCFVLDMYILGYVGGGMVIPYDEVPYIDLEKPYWDASLNKCVTIGDVSYFAFGAYDLSYYDLTHILTFNKIMIDNYGLDNPYELVRSGEWTFDKLYEMAQTATDEINGDGRMTNADSYGFVSVPELLDCGG